MKQKIASLFLAAAICIPLFACAPKQPPSTNQTTSPQDNAFSSNKSELQKALDAALAKMKIEQQTPPANNPQSEPEPEPAISKDAILDSIIVDYIPYKDWDDMAKSSDAVILVTATTQSMIDMPFESRAGYLPYTKTEVTVDKVFYGTLNQETAEILQLGQLNTIPSDGEIYLEPAKQYLLVVTKRSNGMYNIINPAQGIYLVEQNKIIPRTHNELIPSIKLS